MIFHRQIKNDILESMNKFKHFFQTIPLPYTRADIKDIIITGKVLQNSKIEILQYE